MKIRKIRLSFNTILITVLFVSLILFIVFCISAAEKTETRNSGIKYMTFSGTYTLSSDKLAEDIPPDRKINIDYGFSDTIKFKIRPHNAVSNVWACVNVYCPTRHNANAVSTTRRTPMRSSNIPKGICSRL